MLNQDVLAIFPMALWRSLIIGVCTMSAWALTYLITNLVLWGCVIGLQSMPVNVWSLNAVLHILEYQCWTVGIMSWLALFIGFTTAILRWKRGIFSVRAPVGQACGRRVATTTPSHAEHSLSGPNTGHIQSPTQSETSLKLLKPRKPITVNLTLQPAFPATTSPKSRYPRSAVLPNLRLSDSSIGSSTAGSVSSRRLSDFSALCSASTLPTSTTSSIILSKGMHSPYASMRIKPTGDSVQDHTTKIPMANWIQDANMCLNYHDAWQRIEKQDLEIQELRKQVRTLKLDKDGKIRQLQRQKHKLAQTLKNYKEDNDEMHRQSLEDTETMKNLTKLMERYERTFGIDREQMLQEHPSHRHSILSEASMDSHKSY